MTPKEARRTFRWEVVGVAVLIAAIVAGYGFAQRPITVDDGHPWDAAAYRHVAMQFGAGHAPAEVAPQVYRIGVPWLVSRLTPGNLTLGFRVIDLVSIIAAALLFWLFLRLFLRHPSTRLVLVAVFLTSFTGPYRLGLYIVGLTYSAFWLFLIGGLLTFEWMRRRPGVWPLVTLAVLMLTGSFVRETMLLLVPVAFFVPASTLGIRAVRVATAAVPGVFAVLVTHAVAQHTNAYTFTSAARDSLHALTPAGVVVAGFVTLGAPLVLCCAYPKTTGSMLRREPHLAALIGVVAILAALGGTNTEVFLTWSIPAVFVVAGLVFEAHWYEMHVAVIALLVAAQLLLGRVLWPIPDYLLGRRSTAVLTPLGINVRYLDLASTTAPHDQNTTIALQCLILVALVAIASRGPKVVAGSDSGVKWRTSLTRRGAVLAAVIVVVGVVAIVTLGVSRSPKHNQIVAAQRGDDQRVCAATGIAMNLQADPAKDPTFTDDMNAQYQIMRDAFTEPDKAHTVLINDPLYYPVNTWFSGDPSTNTVYGPNEKAAILTQCAALGFPITLDEHPPG